MPFPGLPLFRRRTRVIKRPQPLSSPAPPAVSSLSHQCHCSASSPSLSVRPLGSFLSSFRLQSRMLESLDQDVDTTNMRLKAARKKMQEIIRKSGSNSQLCLVITLSIILVIVAALAFS